jgi:hypothetical protein
MQCRTVTNLLSESGHHQVIVAILLDIECIEYLNLLLGFLYCIDSNKNQIVRE